MNDLWAWISESIDHFRETGDRSRFEIAVRYHQGMQCLRQDPQEALSHLEIARQLAERFGERWWMALCDHWRCQILIHRTGAIDQALEIMAPLLAATEADPAFKSLPQRVCLRDDRANALHLADPDGFAGEIEASCRYIEADGCELESCSHCVRNIRIDALLHSGQFDAARDQAREGLQQCRSRVASHYIPQYYAVLCRIANAAGEWEQLERWSRSGPLYYGKMGEDRSNIELLMWHAYALLRLNRTEEARAAYRAARKAHRHANYVQTVSFYDALAAYLEHDGRPQHAFVARGMLLARTTGAPYTECVSRLERIRLLKLLGRPADAETALFREAAERLTDPQPMIARLTKPASGAIPR